MLKLKSFFLTFLILLILSPQIEAKETEKNYLVGFIDNINENIINDIGGDILSSYKDISVVKVTLDKSQLSKLKNSKSITFIEQDGRVNLHTLRESKLEQQLHWGFTTIKTQYTHNNGFFGKGVKIAILDTGIDKDHEDLSYEKGRSFISNVEDYEDDNGHGTHVTGIIGAQDNSVGTVGVSPASKLYIGKVLDSGGEGFISDIIEGINWSIEQDVDVITMSFGTEKEYKSLKKVIKEAYKQGITIVASSGNSGENTLTYPASHKNVLSVGAVNKSLVVPDFSNYSKKLDIVAPGVDIYSTFINGYKRMSGTSMAAPYVTGTVALLLEKQIALKNKEIEYVLKNSAIGTSDSIRDGYGMLDASESFNLVK